MPRNFSTIHQNKRLIWYTEKLWELARELPTKRLLVHEVVNQLNNIYWFKTRPTSWQVATHAKKIYEADLSYPIILSVEGQLMDGAHRVSKAWILELQYIEAVQFEQNPDPDETIPL